MSECMLTTKDNPFDPFDQFDSWLMYDTDKGYNSCAFLARVARPCSQLSDSENEREIERAIDEIIKYDFTNNYKKVTRSRSPQEV